MEDQRMQHQNSIKNNILKLSISCFKNLPRISGAIPDLAGLQELRERSFGLPKGYANIKLVRPHLRSRVPRGDPSMIGDL